MKIASQEVFEAKCSCGASINVSASASTPPPGWARGVGGWRCPSCCPPDLNPLLDEMTEICEKLEQGPPLEEHLRLYERGVQLQNQISAALGDAERRLIEVVGQDGTMTSFGEVGAKKV